MKLFVTRHGQTDYNEKGLLSGTSPAMLTEKGKGQAKDLAERILAEQENLNIKTIFVSPLQRAIDTSAYIEDALELKAIVDDRLKEVDFGDMENESWPSDDFSFRRANPFVSFPNGESLAKAGHRAYSIVEEVREKYKNQDGNILFVCHGLITVLMTTFFNDIDQENFAKVRMKNCELLEFDLD